MLLMFCNRAHFKQMPLLAELAVNRGLIAIIMALLRSWDPFVDHEILVTLDEDDAEVISLSEVHSTRCPGWHDARSCGLGLSHRFRAENSPALHVSPRH